MAAILKSKMAATGTNEKNGNNLICIPGSLLHHLRPKNQIVHEPPTNNISNQTKMFVFCVKEMSDSKEQFSKTYSVPFTPY